MKAILLLTTALVSLSAFASPLDVVAKDELVQDIVTRMAAQSPSGDPVYCSFEKPLPVALQKSGSYQVEFLCGSGSANEHMENLKVFVKGYILDGSVYVTGVQMDKKLK